MKLRTIFEQNDLESIKYKFNSSLLSNLFIPNDDVITENILIFASAFKYFDSTRMLYSQIWQMKILSCCNENVVLFGKKRI